jgi:hypothetical protein
MADHTSGIQISQDRKEVSANDLGGVVLQIIGIDLGGNFAKDSFGNEVS